jgi:predicted Fe-Mo cluster-binding NifX family protein
MKVFIAVDTDAGLESQMANRFARAGYFLIYDMEENKIVSMQENTFKNDAQGVGIRVSTLVTEKGCGAIIGAQPGPKAADVLTKAGVKMLTADTGTAGQAIERFRTQLMG